MSSYRYQNTPIERDSKGKRFFPTNLYNQVDPQADDIYLITDKGDRLDNLAYEYYGDPSLWWVLSSANARSCLAQCNFFACVCLSSNK